MLYLSKRFRGAVTLVLSLAIAIVFPLWVDHDMDGRLAIRVITAESANQSLWCMIGVGEVIRNRGKFQGFSVMKKDLNAFYHSQSIRAREKARMAWVLSRITNLTQHSTHFENVKDFGPPPWEAEMNKTVHLDDLQFYKRKPKKK